MLPVLPSDLTGKSTAELPKLYGIDGFCYLWVQFVLDGVKRTAMGVLRYAASTREQSIVCGTRYNTVSYSFRTDRRGESWCAGCRNGCSQDLCPKYADAAAWEHILQSPIKPA